MRSTTVILDANQAGEVHRRSGAGCTLVLAPAALAEVLLGPHADRILDRVASHDIIVGLASADATAAVAALTKQQIREFIPFPYEGAVYQSDYSRMLDVIDGSEARDGPEAQAWASEMKSAGRSFSEAMKKAAAKFAASVTSGALGSGKPPKFATLDEALEAMAGVSRNSYLEAMIWDIISDACKRQPRTRRRDLPHAVLQNPNLRRLFMMFFTYTLGCSRLLAPHRLHIDPTEGRDDLTDLLLPAYAQDGAIVATADKLLHDLGNFVDPAGAVQYKPVLEIRAAGIDI